MQTNVHKIVNNNDNNKIESHKEQVLTLNTLKNVHDIIPWFGNPLAFGILNLGECEIYTHVAI